MTKPVALSAPDDPRDQARDQTRDHETKPGHGLGQILKDFFVAIEQSSEQSLPLAEALAATVLSSPLVRLALDVQEHLRTRSPFALVRAMDLAEQLADQLGQTIKKGTGS